MLPENGNLISIINLSLVPIEYNTIPDNRYLEMPCMKSPSVRVLGKFLFRAHVFITPPVSMQSLFN
jgi:hypothetical protein